MTLTNGKWLVSDFQDFDEPTYTEVLRLTLEEAEAGSAQPTDTISTDNDDN